MENFKTWQEYFEKMKAGTGDAVGSIKSHGSDVVDAFRAGYAAAKEKTDDVLHHKYTPTENFLIGCGILLLGVLAGMVIGSSRRKAKAKCDKCEDEE